MFKSLSQLNAIILKKMQFHCSFIKNNDNDLEKLTVSFIAKTPYDIYFISKIGKNGKKIVTNFNKIDLKMNKFQAILFISKLIEGISGYLFNLRSEILGEGGISSTMLLTKNSLGQNNYSIRFKINANYRRKDNAIIDENKKLKEGTNSDRYRLFISVFKEDQEIVEIPLTRRDIVYMLQYIKETFRLTDIKKIHFLTVISATVVDGRRDILASKDPMPVTIDFETIGFSDIFLHNQEILNLYQLVERLIFEPSIQDRLQSCGFSFRQVKAYVENKMFFLYLRKMKTSFEDVGSLSVIRHKYVNENKNKKIFVGNILLAGLYLTLTPSMVINSAIKEDTYYNDRTTEDYLQYLHHTKGQKRAVVKILTKEGTLGISRAKHLYKEDKGTYSFFKLHGVASKYWDKDSFSVKYKMSNTKDGVNIKHYENDNVKNVPILEDFTLYLNNQWSVFLSMLSVAYSKLFSDNLNIDQFFKDDLNFRVINVYSNDHKGHCLYKIKLLVDKNNVDKDSGVEYSLVLNIEKYRTKKEKIGKDVLHDQNIEAKFRIPLTRRYLFEFISIAKEFGRYIDGFAFKQESQKNELLPVVFKGSEYYKNGNDKINYGIRKKNKEEIITGEINSKFGSTMLSYSDRVGIEMSTMYRILFAKWLPFVGRSCSISDDGYYCDLQKEFQVEKGSYGSLYAWDFLYGVLSR